MKFIRHTDGDPGETILATVTIKDPLLGNTRSFDSGIITRTNLAGNLRRFITQKTTDIRLYKFKVPYAQAISLYNFVDTYAALLIRIEIGSERLDGIISADELELSSVRPNPCGISSFSLRVRVIDTEGLIGLPKTICRVPLDSTIILDHNNIPILDYAGGPIHDN